MPLAIPVGARVVGDAVGGIVVGATVVGVPVGKTVVGETVVGLSEVGMKWNSVMQVVNQWDPITLSGHTHKYVITSHHIHLI